MEARDTIYCIGKMGINKRERNQLIEQGPSFKYLATWNVVSSLIEFERFPQAAEATSKEGQQTSDKYIKIETPR